MLGMMLLPWHVAEVSGRACGVHAAATATDAGYGRVSSPLYSPCTLLGN